MKLKKYFVTCAAVYPDRSTKTMKRLVEATSAKKAALIAVSKRRDLGYPFIVLNAPVLVFSYETDRVANWAFTIDLRLGEHVARSHRLNNGKPMLRLLKGVAA